MNEMVKTLANLCFDGLYNYGKTITNRISKSGRELREERRAQFTLYHVIKVFKLWDLPNIIQLYENDLTIWNIRIQDFNNLNFVTIALCPVSPSEFERFKAFLRHLISNWSREIKVQKLDNGHLSFVVTHPAPVLLHIFPRDHTEFDEHSRYSTLKSSHVKTVSKMISLIIEEFCLCILNKPEKLSGNIGEKRQTEETTREQNPDEYPLFPRNDIFTTDYYYYHNIPSDVLHQQLDQTYISACNISQKSQFQFQFEHHWLPFNSLSCQSLQNESSEVERLKAENETIKKSIETLTYAFEGQRTVLQPKINKLIDQNKKMAVIISEKEDEKEEMFLEIGRLNVELTRIQNAKKRDELFNKTYKFQSASTQTSGISEWSNASLDARISSDQTTEVRNNQVESHYGQESLNETASLTDMPHTAVDGNIHNNYKLLLLRISHNLLKEDVLKLKQWVDTEFEIDVSGSVSAIFFELDRKKIISITNLSRLKKFFEDNLRYDFVHLIDYYLLGEYSQLKSVKPNEGFGSFNLGSNAQNGLTSQRFGHSPSAQRSSRSTTRGSFTGLSRGPANELRDNAHGYQGIFHGLSQVNSRDIGGNTGGISSSTQHTQRSVARNGPGSNTRSRHPVTSSSCGKETASNSSNTSQGLVVTDGGRREHGEVQASSRTVRGDQISTSRGSIGHKLSKFQPPDADEDGQWLCSHYKRRCYVKFECCNKFWPCHRCHNNQSTCGRRKLKSRDTKQIKCFACGQEQPFAHHCSRCNAKFARYFCGQCKHLTGTDDNPYHCEKCGIC
ncbi:RING finger and CHY zinc finger domain-containing 1, partial [Paramuricea clavata]